ncbi:MAG: SlyX family protein [Verrucomicrobiota bacterium]|nr:SlyX family protein [Verrucomicrobiota bacterium]
MSELEPELKIDLQSQIAHLQRHIENQDAEIYKFAKRIDRIDQLLKLQSDQIKSLSERGINSFSSNIERPPHY